MTMVTGEGSAPRAGRVVSAVRFLSPAEVRHLAEANGMSQSSTATRRQAQMLGLMQAIGARAGFPQRTIATAQLLYQRFHLFYNARDFLAHEVANACIVVAGKMCDTPKKAREIILHSWALRFPELARINSSGLAAQASAGQSSALAASSSASASTSSPAQPSLATVQGLAHIPEASIDTGALEKERKRIVSIESLLLQSIAFDFNTTVRDNLRYTIKIARAWQLEERLVKLAWQVAADCHRTYAPLSYPSATIALASIYTALLLAHKAPLSCNHRACTGLLRQYFAADGDAIQPWQSQFFTSLDDVEAVMHLLLDMYEGAASQFNSTASAAITPMSPATPASPSEMLGMTDRVDGHRSISSGATGLSQRKLPAHAVSPPPFGMIFWHNEVTPALIEANLPSNALSSLTQIKIELRQAEDQRQRKGRQAAAHRQGLPSDVGTAHTAMYGEATIRHLDIGGVRGDVHAAPEGSIDVDDEPAGQDAHVREKQLASLQRFLF